MSACRLGHWFLAGCFWLAGIGAGRCAGTTEGLSYTNYRVADVPWSIHVAKVPRKGGEFEFQTVHAKGTAIGMSKLSAQIASVDPKFGVPVLAVNGDYYQRDKAFAGDPRGVQIVDGELLSAPTGGVAFWIDPQGNPHASNVVSKLQVLWPNGSKLPCGLNEDRGVHAAELYTPSVGESTHTTGGLELVLERDGSSPWLPLRAWEGYQARVKEVSETGNTPLAPDIMVLSLTKKLAQSLPMVKAGDSVRISTASIPSLKSVRVAIGGGPLLVSRHHQAPIEMTDSESYQNNSMFERHPRTALGWNKDYYFLVVVDGRQKNLSVGMTLDELSRYLVEIGCDEAMNLDGGGSTEMWYDGKVRNSPCDRKERDIANSLVVVRRSDQAH